MFAYTRLPSLTNRTLENSTNSFVVKTGAGGGGGTTGGSGSSGGGSLGGGVITGSSGGSTSGGSAIGGGGAGGSTASTFRTSLALVLKLPFAAGFIIFISYG